MNEEDNNIKQLTKDILQLKKQTVENMIEIGKKLIKVKQQLPHGQFGKYLKEEVDFSTRTANNYMKVVTRFANSQTYSNLEPYKLIILLDVPKNHIDNFTKDNDLSNMSCRKIRKKIKDLKKSIKQEKEKNKNEKKFKKAYENINEFRKEQENKKEDKSNYDEDGSYNPFKSYQSETDKIFEEFFKNFNNGQFNNIPKTPLLDITPEEKKTLKHFYIVLAKNFHPDKGGNEEEMKVLNKLKENWGI